MELLAQWWVPRLLATSVQTVILVGVVWLLCRRLKALPAATQCALWWLVALQAVLGMVWVSPVQLPVLPMLANDSAVVVATNSQVINASTALPSRVTHAVPAAPAAAAMSWTMWLFMAWCAGVALMAARTWRAWRATTALRARAQRCADPALVSALAMASEAHGLSQPPPLYLSDEVNSPQLLGVWRPVVLLPRDALTRMSADELDMALTHELVHLQRRDLWWGVVPAVAQHLFFFHPLVHMAVREYAIAREGAVDTVVVAGNQHCRGQYGRLLLQFGVSPRPVAVLAGASPTFLSLKRRLIMLQTTSPFSRRGAYTLLAAVAVLGVMPLRLVAMAPPAVPPVPAPPPAPPVLTAPAAPAVPALPPLRAVPPAPPVPAAPAVATMSQSVTSGSRATQHIINDSNDATRWVLMNGADTMMHGSIEQLRQAREAANGKRAFWFVHEGNHYLIDDAATLDRLTQVHAQTSQLSRQMGELGAKQGELGAQQGEIGARIGQLAARVGDLAAQEADLAVQAELSGKNVSAQLDAVRKQVKQAQAALDQASSQTQMQRFEAQQQALSKQQSTLGEQYERASVAAKAQTQQLMEQSLRNGVARRI